MSESPQGQGDQHPAHPIGTLVVIGVYGLLFAIGWLAVYLFLFLPRGRVTP